MVYHMKVEESIVYYIDIDADSKAQAKEIARSACEKRSIDQFIDQRWIFVREER